MLIFGLSALTMTTMMMVRVRMAITHVVGILIDDSQAFPCQQVKHMRVRSKPVRLAILSRY